MSHVQFPLPERYRVTGHVASGGMAAVYAAHDELLDRNVAVKVLAEHLNEDASARARFNREARAAAGLSSHPHVVTIYDVGEFEGRSFIVMELLNGGSLAAVLRSGREIPRETTVRWLRDAASALDAAHAAGIVHRDIKPPNLLLDDRGGLAIADFGIARIAQEEGVTVTGQVLGTAAYLSPEQALGEPATAASDRYALAVVAFELLTGRRPFAAEHFAAQARAHIEEDPPRASDMAPGLPARVDEVLDRGLSKEPAARWGSAAAFVAALDEALDQALDEALSEDEPESTRIMAPVVPAPRRRPAPTSPTTPPPPRRQKSLAPLSGAPEPDRRRRLVPLVLGGVLALLLGAVAVAALGGGDDSSSERSPGSDTSRAERTATPSRTPTRTATEEPTPEPAAPPATETETETPAPAPTPTPTPTPSPTPESGGGGVQSARTLNDDGFTRYQAGDYAGAVPLLQQAVEACGDSTAQDPCAYALYNLGSALHRSGRSADAIPHLERRLEISDFQRGVVRRELRAARAAAD